MLFTNDDPTKHIEAGYTIVNLDSNPFTFTKERISEITLYEGDVAINDLSELSYTEAFNSSDSNIGILFFSIDSSLALIFVLMPQLNILLLILKILTGKIYMIHLHHK